MNSKAILASALLAAASLHAQSIPATRPTQSVSELPSAQLPTALPHNADTRVTWNGSQLTIEASGEPMPEVLGRVARETGMKVTGGVPDEHLYGKYGPGSVQTVLGQMFDGLAVNMMLVNESPTKPKELILTDRTGGPTPPSTRQIADNWQPGRQSQPIMPAASQPVQRQPVTTQPQQSGNTTSQPAFPTLSAPPTVNNSFTNVGNADTVPAPTSDTSNSSLTQPQSPNGVKTPEQIFEELRKRLQGTQPQ